MTHERICIIYTVNNIYRLIIINMCILIEPTLTDPLCITISVTILYYQLFTLFTKPSS